MPHVAYNLFRRTFAEPRRGVDQQLAFGASDSHQHGSSVVEVDYALEHPAIWIELKRKKFRPAMADHGAFEVKAARGRDRKLHDGLLGYAGCVMAIRGECLSV